MAGTFGETGATFGQAGGTFGGLAIIPPPEWVAFEGEHGLALTTIDGAGAVGGVLEAVGSLASGTVEGE